jgi:prepilin signal peptidase PulO-like enzyme (type II secretory pathway)
VLVQQYWAAITLATLLLVAVAVLMVREDSWLMWGLIVAAPAAAAAAVIDARITLIPTPLTYIVGAAAVLTVTAAAATSGQWAALGRAAAGVGIVGTVYLIRWWLTPLGLGDVRLAAVLAIFAGWDGWFTIAAAVIFPLLAALPFALWGLARRGRHATMPFGPAIVAGTYLAVALIR